MSVLGIFKEEERLPVQFIEWFPKPLNQPFDSDSIIIATDFEETQSNPGIYKYNLHSNELLSIYKYNKDSRFESHGHCIDPINNTMYLSSKHINQLTIFTLHDNKMKYLPATANAMGNTAFMRPVYIPLPTHQIYILQHDCNSMYTKRCLLKHDCTKQYKYNIETKSITTLKHCSLDINRHPKVIYIPFLQKLFIFGSNMNKTILHCNVNNFEWVKYNLTMPFEVHDVDYDILLGFENVLFVFYFDGKHNGAVYALDLFFNKWYKSNHYLPHQQTCFQQCNMYVVKNKYDAHLLDFDQSKHFKVSLFDLMPTELVMVHRKYYNKLIMGYLRERENQSLIPIMPHVLKVLILNFFQMFSPV
eukprot:503168_1